MTREAALNLAIKALDKVRKDYSVGNNLYLSHGDNPPEFACRDRKEYSRYTRAIAVVEGLK